jgi:cell division protein FtsQ
LQQVKSEAFLAGARPVDPRALPVPLRAPRNRIATRLNRAWVLHGRIIRRALAVAVLLAGGTAIYAVRQPVGDLFATLGGLAQIHSAQAGMAIDEISITGQTLTTEQDIFDALGIQPETSTLAFDAEAARLKVAELPAVSSVHIRKIYPDQLDVVITEKLPIARWRVDGVTFVIDGNGDQIGEDGGNYSDLPLVIGDGAADDALAMIRAMDGFPKLGEGLIALSRIADRRWDLIYDTGLRVQLPAQGVAQAMTKLESYQQDYQLMDRDISIIDLRVDTIVAVRLNKTEDPEDTEES